MNFCDAAARLKSVVLSSEAGHEGPCSHQPLRDVAVSYVCECGDGPRSFPEPPKHERFLDGFSAAHEAGLQTAIAQGTPVKRRETGLRIKGVRPDMFESNEKGCRSLTQCGPTR